MINLLGHMLISFAWVGLIPAGKPKSANINWNYPAQANWIHRGGVKLLWNDLTNLNLHLHMNKHSQRVILLVLLSHVLLGCSICCWWADCFLLSLALFLCFTSIMLYGFIFVISLFCFPVVLFVYLYCFLCVLFCFFDVSSFCFYVLSFRFLCVL